MLFVSDVTAQLFKVIHTVSCNFKELLGGRMDKLVVSFSAINIAILELGSLFFPDRSFMWLAGTTLPYNILRAVILALLIALLVTKPPRNFYLRLTVGIMSIGVITTVLYLTFGTDSTMPVLDSLTLAAASVAMGLMAIEVPTNNYEKEDYVDIEALRHSKHRSLHAR